MSKTMTTATKKTTKKMTKKGSSAHPGTKMKLEDVDTAFRELVATAKVLRNSSVSKRQDRLRSLWQEILMRKADLIEAGRLERRTHELDIAAELMMIKGEVEFAIKQLPKWMKPLKVKGSLATLGKKCQILYQSKGVVLNIAAYNAPAAESFVPLIAAVSAGNSVAIKPSEHAPHSAQIIKEIVNKVFPSGEVDVFLGGVQLSKHLLKMPFDHIYYTGGQAVGKIVMTAAAQHLTPVTLEMGGKSPVIIDQTAQIENAAKKIAWGRVMNAGQVCIAPEYVIVHESVEDAFVKALSAQITELYDSEKTGLQKSNYVPRIINQVHTKRVKALVDDAVSKGAEKIFGGASDLRDHYIEPTILGSVNENMDIMKEEVFGPVITVMTYFEKEQVIDIIARRPNPLALYIYSTDQENIDYFLSNTSSGSAVVNNNCIQSGTNPHLPFGGVGGSGMGRIGGYEGFKTMSNARSLVYQPLDRFRDFLIQLPPYSERYHNIIMKALK